MISRYTEKNGFGGYTWQIKNSPTVRVHIKETSEPCEYTIEMQEFGWFRWSTVKSRISEKSLTDYNRRSIRVTL